MSKWPMVKLGEVCEINPRSVSDIDDETEISFVPMQSVSEISKSIIAEESRKYFEVSKGYTPFKNGDVLLAKITPCFENGKVAIAKIMHDYGMGSTEFHVFRPCAEKHLNRYLYYFFQLPGFIRDASRNMTGTAGQKRVPKKYLETIAIPLPPLAEQKRIVELLDRAQNLIDRRKEQLTLMDTLIQSLFYETFGDPVKNEKGWKVKKLGEVCLLISDGVHAKPDYVSSGVSFISVKDLINGEISFSDTMYISERDHKNFNKRCNPEKGDILYTKVGARYGRPAIVKTDVPFSIYVSLALIKPNYNLINSVYLKESLISPFGFQQACGAIKGIGVPDLHLIEIKKFMIPLPPLPLQQTFADRVEKIESEKQKMSASLVELEQTFNALMQEAFNG